MRPTQAVALGGFLLQICLGQECQECQSYGIDFLSGGSYFQNSESTEAFTALQEFEGCANDTANNIFIDPNGEWFECTLSQLTPDDTPQLVTCPINKNQLFDGDWTLEIISNNGGCDPIAYRRDFFLSVGPQQTTTVSPTVVITTTSTPIITVLQTTTQIVTQTANPSTTTVPRATITPTITKHPLPKITIVTKAIFTVTKVKQVASIVSTSFTTTTPKCKPTAKHRIADPTAGNAASIIDDFGLTEGAAESTLAARSGTTAFRRAILDGRAIEPEVKARFLRERREKVALEKRAPDQPVITTTDSEGEPVT